MGVSLIDVSRGEGHQKSGSERAKDYTDVLLEDILKVRFFSFRWGIPATK